HRHLVMCVPDRFCLDRDSGRSLGVLADFAFNLKNNPMNFFKLQCAVKEDVSCDVKSLTSHSNLYVTNALNGWDFFNSRAYASYYFLLRSFDKWKRHFS